VRYEVRRVLRRVGGEDERGGGAHPQFSGGVSDCGSLCHGQDHKQASKRTFPLPFSLLYSILNYVIFISFLGFIFQAGEKAVSCGVTNTSSIDELSFIKELHLRQAKKKESNLNLRNV
jgi:hypothetical protein